MSILVSCNHTNEYKSEDISATYTFKTPNDLNDVVLAYYECDTLKRDSYYYLISGNGEITVLDCTLNKVIIDYNHLNSYLKSDSNKLKINTFNNLENILNNFDIIDKNIISEFTESIFPKAEKRYEIVQQYSNEPDIYYLVPIRKIQYQAGLGKNPQGEFKCTSNYTDEICDYIDYAVNKVKKTMV
jgi:hypothetical protein